MVEFTLDGRTVSAPEGELLVHAAARHDTFIPTLCHDDKLDPYGGCRMCVVGVEGAPRPMPACATRVTEGMVISTNGQITDFQRTLTEMLLSEHLNPSPGCQIDLNLDPETKHIVKVTSKDEYLPNEGNLCVKGRFAFNFVHHPDRLTEPLVRGKDGELHATTWEHALETAAAGLRGVRDEHGPQAIGFLSSARLTMEENFLIQKLARTVVGTNSVHSCEAT